MVYCLLVLCGHLVLRIYCYLEHNFPRCLSTALGIFTLGENLPVILMFTKVGLVILKIFEIFEILDSVGFLY